MKKLISDLLLNIKENGLYDYNNDAYDEIFSFYYYTEDMYLNNLYRLDYISINNDDLKLIQETINDYKKGVLL